MKIQAPSFRQTFFVQSISSNPIRLGLDGMDWTEIFGRKDVGRKLIGRKVGLPYTSYFNKRTLINNKH